MSGAVSTSSCIGNSNFRCDGLVGTEGYYPDPDTFDGAQNRMIHTVIAVRCFKFMLAQMSTLNAKRLRSRLVDLEEILGRYIEYRNCFRQMRVATQPSDTAIRLPNGSHGACDKK